MLSLTNREVGLLYKYADREIYIEHEGGTLEDSFYIVCPCCGWHDINEEDLDNAPIEVLVKHKENCEFKEYSAVLNKLKEFIEENCY